MIFDFDGTLADSLPWFLGTMDGYRKRFGGKKVDPADLPRLRTLGPGQILAELGMPLWKLPIMVNHVRERMAGSVESIPLFDGIADVLHGLSGKGVKVAVVSSIQSRTCVRCSGRRMAG